MKSSRQGRERLQKALAAAYLARRETRVSPGFKDQVMACVRAGSTPARRAEKCVSRRRAAWRLAPAAGLLIVVLAVILHTYVFSPKTAPERVSLDDPAEVVVAQLFWIK